MPTNDSISAAYGGCFRGYHPLRQATNFREARKGDVARSARWICVFLAAGLALFPVAPALRTALEARRDLSLLRRAFSGGARIDGRLSRSLNLPARRSPAPPGLPPEMASALARRADALSGRDEPGARRTHGLFQLAEGRFNEAVAELDVAVRRDSPGDGALSDLAAALLSRARATDRPLDLLAALETVERAAAANPSPEALFNRAVSLSRLHLRSQARQAWEEYLAADPSSPWSAAADAFLRELSQPTLAELWARDLPRLERAARQRDAATVREIVSRFPQAARLYTEEQVLPAWGAAVEAADPEAAAGHLAVAREIGIALTSATRDFMIQDAAEEIARAAPARRTRLAEGHSAFGKAMGLYYVQKLADARPLLATAETLLAREASSFAGWPRFYGAVCDHYSQPERAVAGLLDLQAGTEERRYPVLAGRASWMLATLANNLGRPEEALARYQKAFSLIDSSAGPQLSSFVRILLGETYTALGETEEAWRQRLAGLAVVSRSGDPRRAHGALYEAAEALLQEEDPGAALAFTRELQANARAWKNPTALAEAALQKGRALDLLGRTGEALASFRDAAGQASRIAPGALRDRITATLALAEGDRLAGSDPRQAVQVLSMALSTRLDNGYLYQLTRLLTTRARAHLALGDAGRAESDLLAAIEEHERIRGGVRDEQLRRSCFEQAQSAFDEMIRLQVDRHHDPESALEYAERSRSRVLLDLVIGGADGPTASGLPRAASARAIRNGLPPGVTLVEYAVLPDRLLAWIVSHGTLDLVRIDLPEKELAREVGSFRDLLERRETEARIRTAAAPLYDALIRPLRSRLPAGTLLVFVPDRSLARVPFAALFDRKRGRYLVEDRATAVAPSATLYLAALERRRELARGERGPALVIGDPAFRGHPRLSRLAKAREEAGEVAALYPGAELLQGEAATREAFLRDAPQAGRVHFAGHALLHPFSPRLSQLLLAPGDDASGALYAADIARLRLPRTEIVVLSSCRTLDGRSGGRESVLGLAAAFLAAGPPVVVSSLWDAPDNATQPLMLAFHRALRDGADPAEALRAAQLQTLRAAPAPRSPARWAGFEAVGGAAPSLQKGD